MAQRDKVKELVGRGLNSYHTKALQQIDRIEKKNKEQNHKISILSNELDNDYLTKTEEGSVISLEHSKEGMVYLDELQGNTLVNYCTDGSKELTLNGDIDTEGTFVTTTEGVDNGKVDVYCEGNTLVNLVKGYINGGVSNSEMIFSNAYRSYYTDMVKPNTTYTVITYKNGNRHLICESENFSETTKFTIKTLTTQINDPNDYIVTKVTTSASAKYLYLYSTNNSSFGAKVLFLEGDWTNRDLPPYFEGMKSVGQHDENGHKIEILSQSSYPNLIKKSKNLSGNRTGSDSSNNNGVQYLREDNVEFARVSANKQDFSNFYWWLQTVEPRKKGETYTISYDYRCISDWGGYWYPSESYSGSFFPSTNGEWRRMKITRTVTSGDAKGDMLFGVNIRGAEIGDYIDIKNVKMEKGTNNSKWIPSVMDEEFLLAEYSNKKEILINEPLRGLPNGTIDRIVKIGGKYFIEKNCRELILDGSNMNNISNTNTPNDTTLIRFEYASSSIKNGYNNAICDMFPQNDKQHFADVNYESIDVHPSSNTVVVWMKRSRLQSEDVNGLKTWLTNNPLKIVYALTTPIYEPLETEPVLNTYNDITHISNNSIIPCNMKIKNTGYNAIIKPSTLYTVALDTNKSGTIGINLGGAKVTTTNNVATVTTPATLSDDSLRLYGKGINGSKVRLIEGDKTNWIPSFFEGMKSSFEDKFDSTDNTYKMEILSNNKNLFDGNWTRIGNSKQHETSYIKVSPNSNYIFSVSDNYNTNSAERRFNVQFYDKHKKYLGFIVTGYLPNNVKINTPYSCKYIKIITRTNTDFTGEYTNIEDCDVQLEKGMEVTSYVSPKSNKIQFLLDEPLRKIDDILKDKFTFKDGKLMIERNCIEKTLDGSETWHNDGEVNNGYLCCYINNTTTNMSNHSKRTFKCNILPYEGVKRFNYEQATRSGAGFLEFILKVNTNAEFRQKISELRPTVIVGLAEPIYEEVPYELAKIILEGYENGTLFIDTNIPPTSTVTYAGETPIVKATKLNKTEVLNNTEDINDNIIPYLMDMDYRVVMLQLATEEIEGGVSMARLFGGTYEMIKRDILSKRLTREEYGHRLADYFNAGKLTEEQVRELEELR